MSCAQVLAFHPTHLPMMDLNNRVLGCEMFLSTSSLGGCSFKYLRGCFFFFFLKPKVGIKIFHTFKEEGETKSGDKVLLHNNIFVMSILKVAFAICVNFALSNVRVVIMS